jgi:hypothetical protein
MSASRPRSPERSRAVAVCQGRVLYPEIRGLGSPTAPVRVTASGALASALPVARPPSSCLFFGWGRRS